MKRADALNLHIYPVRTEMNATKKIIISYVFSTDKSKLEEFLVDENLSQVFSTDEDESKIIIADESSTGESESECVHEKHKQIKRCKE